MLKSPISNSIDVKEGPLDKRISIRDSTSEVAEGGR